MCLRFVFLLITRLAAWRRLSRREEVRKTAEILILRHQLAVGDPIIWEHLRMLDKESYRRSWDWKLGWYEQAGYRLGENLFTIKDDESGGLDQTEITRVAQEIDDLL